MSITDRMIRAARLDASLYEEVEADTTLTGQATAVVLLAAVAAGIGALGRSPGALVGAAIAALVGWYIWAGITYLVGVKLLPEPQTKADFGQLLRTIGFASAPGVIRVLGIIPGLRWLTDAAGGLWMLVAMVVAVHQALDYTSPWRAVAVVIVGWIVFMIGAWRLAVGTIMPFVR